MAPGRGGKGVYRTLQLVVALVERGRWCCRDLQGVLEELKEAMVTARSAVAADQRYTARTTLLLTSKKKNCDQRE